MGFVRNNVFAFFSPFALPIEDALTLSRAMLYVSSASVAFSVVY